MFKQFVGILFMIILQCGLLLGMYTVTISTHTIQHQHAVFSSPHQGSIMAELEEEEMTEKIKLNCAQHKKNYTQFCELPKVFNQSHKIIFHTPPFAPTLPFYLLRQSILI